MNQARNDANRTRPAKSFSLPVKAIDRLEQIADFWEVSKSAAVARLIMEAKVEGLAALNINVGKARALRKVR